MKTKRQHNRTQRGHTLIELIISAAILSAIIVSAGGLLAVAYRQQIRGRNYSQAQTDLRTALRIATRSIRHGYNVVATSTDSNFPSGSRTSGASQVIVRVPEPSTSSSADVEIRIYVSSGVMYAQRSDQATPGKKLMSGVSSLTINYFRTIAGTQSDVDGSPGTATEVCLTLASTQGILTTTATAYVTMRNAIEGL